MKLTLQDIVILHEGQQVRKKIEEKYGTLQNFYESGDSEGLSLKAIRNYCSSSIVESKNFKLLLIEKLGIGWNQFVLSEIDQVYKFVKDISENIHIYTADEDYEVLNSVSQLCVKHDLLEQKIKMKRNFAWYYYQRGNNVTDISIYRQAIEELPEIYVDTKIMLHVELADRLYRERDTEATLQYNIAKEYTAKANVTASGLYMYYNRYGIMLNQCRKHQEARNHFENALEYALINNETTTQIGAIIMAIGSTYKREKKYNEAKEYYLNALKHFDANDAPGLGSILNNLSDIYLKLGDIKKAIEYIEQAMNLLRKQGITSKYLLCVETYAEIKLMENSFDGCNKYFEVLELLPETTVDKNIIRNSISSMIELITDIGILNRLESILYSLAKKASNEIYRDDLYSCIGRLNVKIKYKEGIV